MHIKASFNGDRVYRLWDNLYASFQKNMSYFDDFNIWAINSRGARKIKNVYFGDSYQYKNIVSAFGVKKHQVVFICEDFWIYSYNLKSEEVDSYSTENKSHEVIYNKEFDKILIGSDEGIEIIALDQDGVMQADCERDEEEKEAF
mmetsp:Transcript_34942/g.31486  ORF Transcript_34942/g.31486 Transcript_34942/m.31486 type:complete len:145 (+) Transcript_34942:264-698(+)